MKANEVTPQPRQQEFSSAGKCVTCFKPYEAPYGRWGTGGTCSKKCECAKKVQDEEKRAADEKEREKKQAANEAPARSDADDNTPARSGARRLRLITA